MIKNILLAEDDRGTALVVRSQLQSKGYDVHTALNGIEALKILEHQAIDLLITDVVMPKMDGVDLYQAVKQDPKTANIPIIIVTDKAIFKESFANLGVSNFVEKSTDLSVLLEKIKTIENQANEIKRYKKILVSGSQDIVLSQMVKSLQGLKFLVSQAKSSDKILSGALVMIPHVIAIDVLYQDNASAYELIKSLRCFSCLKDTKIVTYTYFPEDLGIDVEGVQNLETAMKLCNQAGADHYIGRFNPSFFVERVMEIAQNKFKI